MSEQKPPRLLVLYLVSFALRYAAGITAWLLTKQFGILLIEDASGYEELGAFVAEDWMAGRSSLWLQNAMADGTQAWLIVMFISAFYFLTAGIRALPVLLAIYCAITALAPLYTFKIARQLGASQRGALIGAWLVAVSPAFLIWSGALYKEGLILVVLNMLAYHGLVLQEHLRWRSVAVIALALPALWGLRFYMAVLMAAALGIGLLFGRAHAQLPGARVASVMKQGALLAALVLVLFGAGFFDRIANTFPTWEQAFTRVQVSRDELASMRSGYLQDLSVATPAEALRSIPRGFVYFMSVPLPWHVGSMRQNIAIPETFLWLLLYPLVIFGIVRAFRQNKRGTLLLIGMAVAICLFYAVFVGNIGTAYRLRIQVWLLLAVFVGWGWDALRTRRGDVTQSEPLPEAVPA